MLLRCPKTIDLAIVGAGSQALTLATYLLQKKQSMRNRFVVLDPSGQWLQQWQHQFAAYEIPHLRSPSVQRLSVVFWSPRWGTHSFLSCVVAFRC